MTKKQYFIALWGISSVASIVKAIQTLMAPMAYQSKGLLPIFLPVAVFTGICINGFLLPLGMDFTQKIGIRLLFLEENVNWIKDFFEPAVVIGVVYACVLLLINIFIPFLVPFSLYAFISWSPIVYEGIIAVLSTISEDAFGMLFVFSGLILLIKKIEENASMSMIVPMVIALMIVPHIAEYFRLESAASRLFVQIKIIMDMILIYTLCWRKSFETAVFCHVVIVTILSLIAPAVVVAFGF